jgi:serine/threonine-protein kinase
VVGGLAVGAARLIGDRYELEAPIGKGGIGEVWRARHVALNSRVAIKFLQLASAEKESAKRRFTTEAQVTAQLKTPNAVQVFDFGITEEGQPYLVMELLEGETLGRRLERVTRLGILETATLLGQAARALQRAHQLGIVHRDFKPDNVIICVDDEGRDQVKVVDFGVAKLVGALEEGADQEGAEAFRAGDATPSFTKTGMVLGTPLYMAPEQSRNAADVDLRADIWAFGVVAFQCLTGRPPFTGATLAELFERIQGGLHPRANFLEPSLPPDFDAWFDVACAPDPSRRFPLANVAWKELAAALDILRDHSGSLPGMTLDPHASSGERRVLVVGHSEPPDSNAATVDAEDTASREVRVRTHSEAFASLQRIPLEALDSHLPHEPPSMRSQTAPPSRNSTLSKARSTALLAGIIGVGTLAAGAALWSAATRSARSAVSPVAVPTPVMTPVDALIATERAMAPLPPPPATSAATAAPAAPSATSPPHASRSPAPRPAIAGALSSAPAPVASPPPAIAAPPPSAKPPLDPGSYR